MNFTRVHNGRFPASFVMETSLNKQEIVRCRLSIFNKLSGIICAGVCRCVCVFPPQLNEVLERNIRTNQFRWLILKMHAFRRWVLRQRAIEPPL